MRSIRIPSLALLAAAALALPAFAGTHYKATTTIDDAAGHNNVMQVEGWVSGDKARIEIKASGNPMAKQGTYILSRDGGKTLYLVNPEDKTYAQWDLNAMLGMVGGIMNGMGPILTFEFSDPKVEKLLDESGPEIVGLPTRHTRFRTSYTMKMRVLGMGRTSDTVSEQDIWSTTKLADMGFGVWLRADPPKTGNESFDRMIASEREKTTGFPLKTVSTTTSTQKGRQSVSKQVMEVTELENRAVPEASFEIPAGFKETQMLPTRPGEEGEEE